MLFRSGEGFIWPRHHPNHFLTKQVSFQAFVKASLSNKELPFFKELPTKPLKLLSRECLSRAS